jgi:DNA topoisomerase-1
MERELDQVAEGVANWTAVLDEFYGDFSAKLGVAESDKGGMRPNQPTDTDVACSECGRPMQVRTGSTGVFLGCSGYSLPPKERCTNTVNLIPGDEVVDVDVDDEGESKLLRAKTKCAKCATPMDGYLIDEGRKLLICGNNPDCDGFKVEHGEFRIKGYEGPVIECDKCGADMQLKSGRFGKYFGCTSADCKNTRKLLRSGEPAPPKADPVPMPELKCAKVDDYYLLRDGASGIFLAASQFPKHRETRAPLVSELIPHQNELDPKFRHLADAPEQDPDGNPAVVKYSRKTKEQFVASEVDGKATKWRAVYKNGKWVEQVPEKAAAKPKKTTRRRTAKGA